MKSYWLYIMRMAVQYRVSLIRKRVILAGPTSALQLDAPRPALGKLIGILSMSFDRGMLSSVPANNLLELTTFNVAERGNFHASLPIVGCSGILSGRLA